MLILVQNLQVPWMTPTILKKYFSESVSKIFNIDRQDVSTHALSNIFKIIGLHKVEIYKNNTCFQLLWDFIVC